jgi:hypothetical protein
VPKGCCLNPPEGKSVAAGTHHPGTEVGEAVAKALERVVPERSCPQVYKMGMPTVIFGTSPRDGKMFIDHSVDTFAAYCGAVKGQDGWGGMNVSFGNLIRATAEINESIFPVRHLWRDYEADSGGAGAYRGNCGSLYRKQVLVPSTIYTYVVGKRYPMPGIAGGRPGAPNRLVARANGAHAFEVGDKAEYIQHAGGECYEYHYGGGGGWGDPPERPAARARGRARRVRLGRGRAPRSRGRPHGRARRSDARRRRAGDGGAPARDAVAWPVKPRASRSGSSPDALREQRVAVGRSSATRAPCARCVHRGLGTVGLNADRAIRRRSPSRRGARSRSPATRSRRSAARLAHVIRTRMFIIDITKAAEATKVHGEFFRDIRPVSTLVQVSRLIDDRALIEIEVDAIVGYSLA